MTTAQVPESVSQAEIQFFGDSLTGVMAADNQVHIPLS